MSGIMDRVSAGNAGHSGPVVLPATIGPERAKDLLKNNVANNRTVRSDRVESYARDMKNGKWLVNGETIKISRTGYLLDGQHRLFAIIASGVSVPMLIAYDVDDEAFTTIDSGAKRTPGDALHFRGVGNSNDVAAAARLLIRYRTDTFSQNFHSITTSDVIAEVERNPVLLESVRPGVTIYKGTRLNKSSCIVGCSLIRECGATPEEIDQFESGVASGANLSLDDPRLALKNFAMTTSARVARSQTQRNHLYAFILAWNAWYVGSPRRILRPSSLVSQPCVITAYDKAHGRHGVKP